MAGHDGSRLRVALAVAVGAALLTTTALAQDASKGAASKSVGGVSANVASPGSGAASPDKLVDPGNGGIAGTGLGKMSPDAKAGAGTGMSVTGPAGQGISSGPRTDP